MAAFKFEIVKKFGVIGQKENGWTKELNLVAYNDFPAKYDIREWDPDHQKMSKGITLSKEELLELKELLKNID
ncbi:MAG: PC4/YdbC family ssDNA-binding protein [Bacillota bacterium]|nr:PC4/YdbC family ssDNA-binding protein [Bacillota bacterium]